MVDTPSDLRPRAAGCSAGHCARTILSLEAGTTMPLDGAGSTHTGWEEGIAKGLLHRGHLDVP